MGVWDMAALSINVLRNIRYSSRFRAQVQTPSCRKSDRLPVDPSAHHMHIALNLPDAHPDPAIGA